MSSRRRVYLNRKQSFLDLFKGQARWMKETYGKESIFEKPYLDQDYRTMHLDIPEPNWGRRKEVAKLGLWPMPHIAHYLFPEAGVSVLGFSPVYGGDPFEVSASVWALFYYEKGMTISWEAFSSRDEVSIVGIEADDDFFRANIKLISAKGFEGEVTITVYATPNGTYQKSFSVEYTIAAWYHETVIGGGKHTFVDPYVPMLCFTSGSLFADRFPELPPPKLFNETRYSTIKSGQVDITVASCDFTTGLPYWEVATADYVYKYYIIDLMESSAAAQAAAVADCNARDCIEVDNNVLPLDDWGWNTKTYGHWRASRTAHPGSDLTSNIWLYYESPCDKIC